MPLSSVQIHIRQSLPRTTQYLRERLSLWNTGYRACQKVVETPHKLTDRKNHTTRHQEVTGIHRSLWGQPIQKYVSIQFRSRKNIYTIRWWVYTLRRVHTVVMMVLSK